MLGYLSEPCRHSEQADSGAHGEKGGGMENGLESPPPPRPQPTPLPQSLAQVLLFYKTRGVS